jgi:hypothetical protein
VQERGEGPDGAAEVEGESGEPHALDGEVGEQPRSPTPANGAPQQIKEKWRSGMHIVADPNIAAVREAFSDLGDVQLMPGREWTPSLVRYADVLLVRSVTPVDAGFLDKSRVRFVGTATSGVDHIDREYLARRDIAFAAAPRAATPRPSPSMSRAPSTS